MRVNLRPRARAMLWPRLVLPTPGGPAKQRMAPKAARVGESFPVSLLSSSAVLTLGIQLAHRQEFQDAVFHLLQIVVVLIQDRAGVWDIELVNTQDVPG